MKQPATPRDQRSLLTPLEQGRLGKAEGITSTAHKLARILYAMITTRKPYERKDRLCAHPARFERRLRHLHFRAAKLGFALIPQQ
jgi:transposase